MFQEGNYSKTVTPGENVTFDCRAEGNPPAVIHWNYTSAVNVMTTPGGRHKTVRVTGATSTNAGVYICVATNKVGSVTRSVTLKMKGIIIDSVPNTYGNVCSEVGTDVDVAMHRLQNIYRTFMASRSEKCIFN